MRRIYLLCLYLIFYTFPFYAQNEAFVVEAENGTFGADFDILEEGDITFARITSNGTGTSPESENRIISFEATFPEPGTYDLFVKIRIGPGAFDDDSYFYGNGFGEKDVSNADDWIRCNGLAGAGYNEDDDYVVEQGTLGPEVWKWVNFSEFTGDETPITFTIEEGELTQIIQVGGREDGLDLDKIAFGKSDLFYTVSNLDNEEAGSETMENEPIILNSIARNSFKFLGNVHSNSQLPKFTEYWNQVTPENAGKWGSVESVRDNMNWGSLDAAYNFAKEYDFYYKHHVLIWGAQQPGWIQVLPEEEQLEEITEWFALVAERYPEMDAIEVVNEPLHQPPNFAHEGKYINALGGTGATGYDWIINSFRLAREYFPDAKLMINDYGIIDNVTNINEYLEIIELLKEENLIDQVGFQAHAFSTRISSSTILANLNRLAEADLPIFVTELDIDGPTDQQQLDDYQKIFPVLWEHPAVKGITLWGFRPGMWRTDQRAFLIDENGNERPALVWLRDYVENTLLNTNNIEIKELGVFPNPFDGRTLFYNGNYKISSAFLYDQNGKLVDVPTVKFESIELNNTIEKGIYYLKVLTNDGVYIDKLVRH